MFISMTVLDIGGGTPSMASIAQIDRLMNAAHKYDVLLLAELVFTSIRHFDLDTSKMEISIETTPKIAAAEPEKIRAYYKMGMRRISMGVQTTDFRQAKTLGREDANASTDYLYHKLNT